jgi:CubicO group peptidase (beta-lactamase class C family)
MDLEMHPIAMPDRVWSVGVKTVTVISRILGCALVFISILISAAEPLAKADSDEKIRHILEHFNVPGAAIGVVKDGKIISATGYGVKDMGSGAAVGPDTIFKIGSNSKAFTVAALALLVDEGKISWDAPVIRYLPDFRLYDPWITTHFTITDLLTHRSGLGPGAGDLMLWPEPSRFSPQEVVHNLRYLKADGQFRGDYAYENLLYIAAGEIIPAATGTPWQTFVQERIIQPLGMRHCYTHVPPSFEQVNLATPHGMVEGRLQPIIRREKPGTSSVSAAAVGIQCSLNDMLIWARLWLRQGKMPDEKELFSAAQHRQMWFAQTIMPLAKTDARHNQSHFSSYGLGWRLNNVDGYLRVHHSGSLAGMYSSLSIFPGLDLAIVVLTNQQSSEARNALMYTTMKPFLGDSKTDWLKVFALQSPSPAVAPMASTVETYIAANPLSVPLAEYKGAYRDLWLGQFFIEHQGNRLQLRSDRVIKLVGAIYLTQENDRFLIRWDDRSLEADVYAQFSRDQQDHIQAMTLIPVSANIDFSYDFGDLNLTKVYP